MVNISQKRFQRLKTFERSQGLDQPQQSKTLPLIMIVFIMGVVMVILFAFATSVNSVILVNLLEGVDQILAQGQPDIDNIGDANVRTAVNDAIDSGITAGVNNVEVNAFLYQFGWLFFIIIMFVVIFLIVNSKNKSTIRSGLI